jgi:hypothetical protein
VFCAAGVIGSNATGLLGDLKPAMAIITSVMYRLKPPSRVPTGRLCFAALIMALLACVLVGSGCGTGPASAISSQELAQAETFPYYKLYWVGKSFDREPLTAADAQKSYNSALGDSLYYGSCVKSTGLLGTGSCALPLQVTTVIYRLHSNATLGPQHNTIIRGVPATIYDGGHSIEIYSGRLAIDIFSNTFSRAMRAAIMLRPLNARGSATGALPAPVYCPGLSGPISGALHGVMGNLPGHPCRAQRALSLARTLPRPQAGV